MRSMRTIETAELLAIGSELTVGETRDTNSGELARGLTEAGVAVLRMTALPDDLEAVSAALAAALERADLVVSTGGLGPTPDDLTREAIAATLDETPEVDPALEAWLRDLFDRRGVPYAQANAKQAWRIPSATAIPNDNGTAPGWWVDRPDGRVIVALPGPPREMRPMWQAWVLPRLAGRGLGRPSATRTLRTTGIGESHIADRLGAILDRGANPLVATYARADGVDIRVSAVGADRHQAEALVAQASSRVLDLVGSHVWATGETTWADAIAAALDRTGWTLAVVERGTRGAVAGLLAEGLGDRVTECRIEPAPRSRTSTSATTLEALARDVRTSSGAQVAMVVTIRERGGDLVVSVTVATPDAITSERRVAFLGGVIGRSRAAILAAAILRARLVEAEGALGVAAP